MTEIYIEPELCTTSVEAVKAAANEAYYGQPCMSKLHVAEVGTPKLLQPEAAHKLDLAPPLVITAALATFAILHRFTKYNYTKPTRD